MFLAFVDGYLHRQETSSREFLSRLKLLMVGNMKYFFRFSALLGSTIFLTFIHNNIKILIRLLKLESACGSYSAVRH